MRVTLTGGTGWVGKHVYGQLLVDDHTIVASAADAVIHLAWEGIPDYENPQQMENVDWQTGWIQSLVKTGTKNVVVAGTIWETCENPPPYVQAKLALYEKLRTLDIILKWVRAPYLYGEGQRESCLLPTLRRRIADGYGTFHVANASLPFMDVKEYARRLVDALSDDRNQIANLPGVTMRVADFCRWQVPESKHMTFVEDYPLRPWEK